MAQQQFAPVAAKERNLRTLDLGLIWFGAAIAITEIWAGGQGRLTILGLSLGLLAIVLGRIIGNGLMAAMARIGADTGLPTMVLTRPAFGVRGSYLPAFLNVVQLVGWTGFMLFVGFRYFDLLAVQLGLPASQTLPVMKLVWVALLGVLCTLWAYGGNRLWRVIEVAGGALLFLLTLALTWVVLAHYDVGALWRAPAADAGRHFLPGMDLVIAMSVSWLPLVADYSRYVKRRRSGAAGTFWGYFIGGVWMYAVGLLVAIAVQTDLPDQMVIGVMGSQGLAWAFAAALLVLLSTVTTTFLDIYSTVVSAQNLWPRLPAGWGNFIVGILGIGAAMLLDVYKYAPFLQAIGAVFLPAFTVVLIDYYYVGDRRVLISQLAEPRGSYWYTGGVNWRAVGAWAVGFLVYDWAGGFPSLGFFLGLAGIEIGREPWITGASLPCLAVTSLAYLLLVRWFGQGLKRKR